MKEVIRIVVVDDHELIRQGLRRLLDCDPGFKVVAEASDGESAYALIKTLQPDVVIADMNMPKLSGYDLLLKVKLEGLLVKVILLTVENQREILIQCIEAGADGYILKESAGQEIFKAVHQVVVGDSYIDPNLVGLLFGRLRVSKSHVDPFESLTQREREILNEIVKGKTNKEISEVMFLAEKTVKNHTTAIYRKLNVKDRVNAVLFAVEHHLEQHL